MSLKGKRILVTGGAGFIGSNLVAHLIAEGAFVRVLDNLLTGRYQNIKAFESHPLFEFIEGDITNSATCHDACKGITHVSHQAALGSVPRSIKDPARTHDINVTGFLNMLIAAKEQNVQRFVFASSSSVYGDEPTLPKIEERIGKPLSPYAVSKYSNELYATVFSKNYGLECIGLRYFNVFGPNQDPNGPYAAVIPLFIDKIMKKEVLYIDGDGEQTRDFTYVQNAVQANVKALFTENKEAVNQIYNIAFGENYSLNTMLETIENIMGQKANKSHREARQGDIRNSLADISKAKTLLGYQPQYSFHKGIEEYISKMKSN
jgi:UDP-N-acetylglucosamine 4-epimerase